MVIAVDVATERLAGVPVFLEERRACKPQEAGIGQGTSHVCSQGLVLTAVGLVGQDEDVGVGAQDGINCGRILELLDGGHDCLAYGIAEQLLQVFRGLGLSGIGKAASFECSMDLAVQVGAVGDYDHSGIGQLLQPSQLNCRPEHSQALAASLPVPDHATLTIFPGDTLHGLIDRPKLLVLGDLLDHPVLLSLEDHEVLDEVEQVLFGAYSEEEDVLGCGGMTDLVSDLVQCFGIGILPF
ncbi:MAG: hypothetical protein A4E45_00016 [Methanosaeta sp. PtaB.Bin039]|nr:MAG: hypothetical protein A4E45_00016 [Methanosaeta sp. PtaB.Bin039]